MAKDTLKLSWEWPADRSAQQMVLAVVDHVTIEDPDSIGNSPSMAASLPEPVRLRVHVVTGDLATGTRMSLRLPKSELGDVSAGDQLAMGLVETSICICVEKPPAELDDEAAAGWLAGWTCS